MDNPYAVIGELARQMAEPRLELQYSRSARDLMRLGGEHPALAREEARRRPLLARLGTGREEVERLLDRERRELIRKNEERLDRYLRAASAWGAEWPRLVKELVRQPLPAAHEIMVARAVELLPPEP